MARILVVDDDFEFSDLIQSILEAEGHIVEAIPDGSKVISKFRSAPYEIIVLDLIMPNKDGLEVLIELKKLNLHPKVIAVSGGGYGNAADYLSWAKTLGVDFTLQKPFSKDEFLAAVQACLS